jgi:hypothetical protein
VADTTLSRRIAGVGGNLAASIGDYHPVASMPMQAPVPLVRVSADRVQISECVPLYAGVTAAPVPATAPGRWFQLYAAGRP